MVLSKTFQAKVLEDFKAWSGGFVPEECCLEELEEFSKVGRDSAYTESEVLEFLLDNRVS